MPKPSPNRHVPDAPTSSPLDRTVPEFRLTAPHNVSPNTSGEYVVYWMTAFRRTEWNYALQRAAQWSEELKKPLIIFEPLRVGYRWANDRLHQFVVEGMRANAISLQNSSATYYPYLENQRGEGAGLIEALATRAAVIVGDEYPCFFLKHLPKWFAARATCRYEIVDSNGLMPLRVPDKIFTVAHSYRRFMQKQVDTLLTQKPLANTLAHFDLPKPTAVPKEILRRWPIAKAALKDEPIDWSSFDIDHSVAPTDMRGGRSEARRRWQNFLNQRSLRYNEDRNHPDSDGSSHLSPYLHFGHISAHEIFFELLEHEGFAPQQLARPNGKVNGFWNMSASTEAFLDQLLTWREIGFNQCFLDRHYDSYRSLPAWVRASLQKHSRDKRDFLYTLNEFEEARTHDPLWNAAQLQLVKEGRIHNYLRMLWGKKILHWSRSPEEALDIMIELNNKYALDGRDPNSYSGIFWVLGRYDRPWGPERPIFGTIRYMSSDSTLKKVHLKKYLKKFTPKS